MESEHNRGATAVAQRLLQSGINLPPLPAAGPQLLAFSQKPIDEIDVADFVKLIETDPGLVAKVLQLANSSYFGTVSKIVGLRQAIMHIRSLSENRHFCLNQGVLEK